MTRETLLYYLAGERDQELFRKAREVRDRTIGPWVYLRGLVELSNRCAKDCLYCGIRASNGRTQRYELSDEQVLQAAEYAWKAGYGSVVIQAGERTDRAFTGRIVQLIRQIKELSDGALGITLSLGEQNRETYQRWFEAGAHRYLLRIESSSPSLYTEIHPAGYSFEKRLECLHVLRQEGYQVGTGVMIGIPGQTLENLADDLLFLKRMDIDMCGMGPYIEHPDTPLGGVPSAFSRPERFRLGLRMIALLRLLMPDINIASTTALHALNPKGRELGIEAGANVMMPNLTPTVMRDKYQLYDDKPLNDMDLSGFSNLALGNARGDSRHFASRQSARVEEASTDRRK